ncbi:UNVERIFIED_CONTAM: hypothetical protein GTU68_022695 [Idotea baltica]|nr:hypothetical protein [Idotea baltica]
MTLITFVNVVLRYGFNTGLIWGLEATSFLFAWLVLFGVSYAVKVTAHLGVDAVITLFSAPVRKTLALFAGAVCIFYAALIMKGAWDYWAPFAGLDAWYEVVDIPIPEWLRFIEPIMNEGESYEKLPRFIPYAILPFGAALLLFRFVQATIRIARGESAGLIVSHEAEDAIADVQHMNRED